MDKSQKQVKSFHEKYGLTTKGTPDLGTDVGVRILRSNLIHEELAELNAALMSNDLVEVADALGDLLYVVYGAAVSFGIDMEPVFDEIHRTNMLKDGGGNRADGKVSKPADWQPPRIREILDAQIKDWDIPRSINDLRRNLCLCSPTNYGKFPCGCNVTVD